MLRNALAIKKVKVWVADKRVFFFKNNIDDRIGEGMICIRCVKYRHLFPLIFDFGELVKLLFSYHNAGIIYIYIRMYIAAESLAQQIAMQRECDNRYLAMFEDSAAETNIYVARDHPSLPEVYVASMSTVTLPFMTTMMQQGLNHCIYEYTGGSSLFLQEPRLYTVRVCITRDDGGCPKP